MTRDAREVERMVESKLWVGVVGRMYDGVLRWGGTYTVILRTYIYHGFVGLDSSKHIIPKLKSFKKVSKLAIAWQLRVSAPFNVIDIINAAKSTCLMRL